MNNEPMLRLVQESPRERQWAEAVERRRRKRFLPLAVVVALIWGGVIAALVGAFLATQFGP